MTKTSLLAASLLAVSMHLAGCADPVPSDGRSDGPDVLGQRSEPIVALIDECTSVWSCMGTGELVMHREGDSCMLGDVVLSVDETARYRESSYTRDTQSSWKLLARTLYLEDGTRCDRND